jgi:hypothetical protein
MEFTMAMTSDPFVRILRTGIAFMIVGVAGLLLTLANIDRWRVAPRFVLPICFLFVGACCVSLALINRKRRQT